MARGSNNSTVCPRLQSTGKGDETMNRNTMPQTILDGYDAGEKLASHAQMTTDECMQIALFVVVGLAEGAVEMHDTTSLLACARVTTLLSLLLEA